MLRRACVTGGGGTEMKTLTDHRFLPPAWQEERFTEHLLRHLLARLRQALLPETKTDE